MASDLPFVDELDIQLEASPVRVYLAVARHIERSLQAFGPRVFSRILACRSRGASFSVPPAQGQVTNGFHVARTEAFPGLLGAIYRALVIGSGAHVVVVNQMLAKIARRAGGEGQA